MSRARRSVRWIVGTHVLAIAIVVGLSTVAALRRAEPIESIWIAWSETSTENWDACIASRRPGGPSLPDVRCFQTTRGVGAVAEHNPTWVSRALRAVGVSQPPRRLYYIRSGDAELVNGGWYGEYVVVGKERFDEVWATANHLERMRNPPPQVAPPPPARTQEELAALSRRLEALLARAERLRTRRTEPVSGPDRPALPGQCGMSLIDEDFRNIERRR